MGLQLIVAPALEPVSLVEAKAHCRVDGADEDALIGALIVSARQLAEHLTGRALVTQTWKQTLEAFPVVAIEAPNPPLQSVTEISYLDADGVSRVLSPSSYRVHTSALVGRIVPAYGASWPQTRQDLEAVSIQLVVGYGDPSDVPQAIRQWMLLCIGTWYSQRESIVSGAAVSELPRGLWDGLLDPYRVWRCL